jgi:hypothetical protein
MSICHRKQDEVHHVANIVDYFTNVSKISGPIECICLVTRIATNLEYMDLAYIEGDVPILGLDHFVHVHILSEEPNNLYPCCMVVRRSGYLTRPLDYILVKVLHCSLIRWERHATAPQDCLTLAGELVWRQHNSP